MAKKDKEAQEGGMGLTTGNDGDVKIEDDVQSEDEKINATGNDVPTVPSPETSPKKSKGAKEEKREEMNPMKVLMVTRAAVLFLARTVMTPPDLADFQKLYPSLFE